MQMGFRHHRLAAVEIQDEIGRRFHAGVLMVRNDEGVIEFFSLLAILR
jgi:hypothetical protein